MQYFPTPDTSFKVQVARLVLQATHTGDLSRRHKAVCPAPLPPGAGGSSLPYLLPPSGGSWLPAFGWALLSRLHTSLSSPPRKRSRKESVLWASWCKCLVAHARSEMNRRDILEGHGQGASAETKEMESPLSQGCGGSRDEWQDMGPGDPGFRCASPLCRGLTPFSSITCSLRQSFLDKGHCFHSNFVLLILGLCQRHDRSNGGISSFSAYYSFRRALCYDR